MRVINLNGNNIHPLQKKHVYLSLLLFSVKFTVDNLPECKGDNLNMALASAALRKEKMIKIFLPFLKSNPK